MRGCSVVESFSFIFKNILPPPRKRNDPKKMSPSFLSKFRDSTMVEQSLPDLFLHRTLTVYSCVNRLFVFLFFFSSKIVSKILWINRCCLDQGHMVKPKPTAPTPAVVVRLICWLHCPLLCNVRSWPFLDSKITLWPVAVVPICNDIGCRHWRRTWFHFRYLWIAIH